MHWQLETSFRREDNWRELNNQSGWSRWKFNFYTPIWLAEVEGGKPWKMNLEHWRMNFNKSLSDNTHFHWFLKTRASYRTAGKILCVCLRNDVLPLPSPKSEANLLFLPLEVYAYAQGCLPNWPQEGIKRNKITIRGGASKYAFLIWKFLWVIV